MARTPFLVFMLAEDLPYKSYWESMNKITTALISSSLLCAAPGFANQQQDDEKEKQNTNSSVSYQSEAYHYQDLRDRNTDLEVAYADFDYGNSISVLGNLGLLDNRLSIGLGYTNFSGDNDVVDYDHYYIDAQFNLTNNMVLGASYFEDIEAFKVNFDYVADANFGVWDVGAYVFDGDIGLRGGLLIPFSSAWYYRGDLDWQDFDYLTFTNRVGIVMGAFDLGAEYVLQDNNNDHWKISVSMHF